uniref:Uncharacterized protein n=1 Tax=Vespula pensylvanica TaxID=30213 RepID=A0A834N5K8_VESPE|nr:hypothetical protein H0235_016634 [Vespula pensylvanica]
MRNVESTRVHAHSYFSNHHHHHHSPSPSTQSITSSPYPQPCLTTHRATFCSNANFVFHWDEKSQGGAEKSSSNDNITYSKQVERGGEWKEGGGNATDTRSIAINDTIVCIK